MGMESDRFPVIDLGAPSQQIYRIPVARVRKFCTADDAGSKSVASGESPRHRISEGSRSSRFADGASPVLSWRWHRFKLCRRGDSDVSLVSRYPEWCAVLALGATTAFGAEPPAIFDAHLHYNADAVAAYPVPAALEILRRNGIRAVLAT